MNRSVLAALTLAPLLALPTAQADHVPCAGTLRGRIVGSNLEVRPGTTCVLLNVRVDGSVEVRRGGSVIIRNSTIDGNVDGRDGFRQITVTGSRVDGDLEAERGGSVTVENTRVDGDIELERNSGALRVSRVTVRGDLKCGDNARPPTGGGNRVDGDREGQCRGL